jgi:hypothetical protein
MELEPFASECVVTGQHSPIHTIVYQRPVLKPAGSAPSVLQTVTRLAVESHERTGSSQKVDTHFWRLWATDSSHATVRTVAHGRHERSGEVTHRKPHQASANLQQSEELTKAHHISVLLWAHWESRSRSNNSLPVVPGRRHGAGRPQRNPDPCCYLSPIHDRELSR